MGNFTLTKALKFEAGHRLKEYEGKCRWVHGHNYRVILGFKTKVLDATGMVIDFNVIKKTAGKYLNDHLDHSMLIKDDDVEMLRFFEGQDQKIYTMSLNPTAENLAEHLYYKFRKMPELFDLYSVTVEETPTSRATYCE